jgi:feruloyl esterase
MILGVVVGGCESAGVRARVAEPASKVPGRSAALEVVQPVLSCASLLGFDPSPFGGTGSAVTEAGLGIHDGVAVCAVSGTLAPTIGFRVLLPAETWTQRYLQTGCGGLCGSIGLKVDAADGCATLARGGFAIASTDMGHQGRGGGFGHDPQKRIDFAYRAVHATALTAKALIARFYGRPPAFSYFSGCSDGGREGLAEAQRYPEDFDGIVAGAPAMNFSVQNSFFHAWQARSNTGDNGAPILTAERVPIINGAVLGACDELDGLKDQVIADPRACRFDPSSIRCEPSQGPDHCLTAAEAEVAKRLYEGPRDPDSGLPLTLGGPQPGSELAWPGVFVPRPGSDQLFSRIIASDSLANLLYETNPKSPYRLESLEFTAAEFEKIRPLNGLYSSTDPDLSGMNERGAKLILWHGWSDPHISPINTIAYFEAVESLLGVDRTASFVKLYLLPGMYHCRGGTGPDRFDMLTAVMDWVESGVEPHAIVTRQGDAERSRSRPVYPYPLVAAYRGKGSPDEAASFVAKAGARGPRSYAWLGRGFLDPGQQLECRAERGRLACGPRTPARSPRN